jgi:hypothetical protein
MHEPVAFINQCDSIEAKLTYHPGDGDLALVLEDADGAEIARASHGDGRRLKSLPLAKGDYRIRIDGAATESVDYVIEVKEKD